MRILLAVLALTVAAPGAVLACPTGLKPAATAELFFGRDVGDQPGVSDDDWRAFVDQEVSPRFADGLSVTDVYGQWRDPKAGFVREPAKALFLVLKGGPDERRDLEAVRAAYKQRFHQESVLLVEQNACVSF